MARCVGGDNVLGACATFLVPQPRAMLLGVGETAGLDVSATSIHHWLLVWEVTSSCTVVRGTLSTRCPHVVEVVAGTLSAAMPAAYGRVHNRVLSTRPWPDTTARHRHALSPHLPLIRPSCRLIDGG